MFHKYLQEIIEKERVFLFNFFQKHHLEEYLGIDISVHDWDNFIDWWDSKGGNLLEDLRPEMSDMWDFFNEKYKYQYETEEVK